MAVGKKKRLIDLEVDEVSLVDKPAIGETVYLTKRVEDKPVAKKKTVTKADDPKTGETVPVTKTEDDSEEEGEEETESEEGVGETTDANKMLADTMNKRFAKIEKNLGDVEDMLAQSLQLHEMISVGMNEMLSLNLGALDAVMMMIQADPSLDDPNNDPTASDSGQPGGAGNQTMSLITDIRESVKAVRQQVLKAGAKMSRSRLQALRDIAAKLTELITSVEPVSAADTEKNAGGKRKAALLAVTKQFQTSLESVTAEVGDVMNKHGELQKAVAKLDERLKGVEQTAGASDAIDDDDSDDGQKVDSSREKSVFHGLIPVDTIRESVRKRNEPAKK